MEAMKYPLAKNFPSVYKWLEVMKSTIPEFEETSTKGVTKLKIIFAALDKRSK